MTKEELQKQIGELTEKVSQLNEGSERIRKEFAKTFNWFTKKDYGFNNYSNGNTELRNPSWEEIFVEVGKLLAAQTFYDLEGNVSELECRIDTLEKNIRNEIHPNLPPTRE